MKIQVQLVCEELGGQAAYKLCWSGAQRVCKVIVPINHDDTDKDKQSKVDAATAHAQKLLSIHTA